mmetsp:Transcript_55704/g.136754  ORF Transcript_55704/g.136754 Transcript_55704/m.136754 type:complete len:242 (+) Transcript_55704:133-858(+)|eukprot:CAMPEP_0198337144 /NCGR_PEP_ID=MMETSP1450-20131203/25414_1 /TAXON_ID=753684 ORGANISM="Madagascaria erythrocladiodes, Strain CCMP3234" /NCGR_SAMPLE_ID=MMETSP1450 /ASSEMBLY_ACC=CAM_ASM_001115 /LENGTH=241 /DNA_ID=CAMNT_0044041929 /DNA_START=123 /DNA_END=848 /DNA_ORIENTATION=-
MADAIRPWWPDNLVSSLDHHACGRAPLVRRIGYLSQLAVFFASDCLLLLLSSLGVWHCRYGCLEDNVNFPDGISDTFTDNRAVPVVIVVFNALAFVAWFVSWYLFARTDETYKRFQLIVFAVDGTLYVLLPVLHVVLLIISLASVDGTTSFYDNEIAAPAGVCQTSGCELACGMGCSCLAGGCSKGAAVFMGWFLFVRLVLLVVTAVVFLDAHVAFLLPDALVAKLGETSIGRRLNNVVDE